MLVRAKQRSAVATSARLLSLFVVVLASQQVLAKANTTGPATLEVGPVAVIPTLGTEARHRSNIYLQEDNEVDSWIALVRPAVVARLQDRDNIYQLGYTGEYGFYEVSERGDDNDFLDHTVYADATLILDDHWQAGADISWSDIHEDRGTGITEGVVGELISEPLHAETSFIGGNVEYSGGTGRLQGLADYSEKRYQNFREVTRNRDLDKSNIGGTFFYPVAPKTDVLAEYRFQANRYPSQVDEAVSLNSDENAVLLGAEWEMSPELVRSTARLGWRWKDFEARERKDSNGLTWQLGLYLAPTDRDTINVVGGRTPEEATTVGDFIDRKTLTASWNHNWSDRVFTTLSATAGQDSFENTRSDREDDLFRASVSGGYQFRRWLAFGVAYEYNDKDSSAEDLSYTDHVFKLTADFSL